MRRFDGRAERGSSRHVSWGAAEPWQDPDSHPQPTKFLCREGRNLGEPRINSAERDLETATGLLLHRCHLGFHRDGGFVPPWGSERPSRLRNSWLAAEPRRSKAAEGRQPQQPSKKQVSKVQAKAGSCSWPRKRLLPAAQREGCSAPVCTGESSWETPRLPTS